MLSYFCSKCGGKNLYQFQKPKFCSHCGVNFSMPIDQTASTIKSNKFEVNINKPSSAINKTNIINHNDFDENDQDFIGDYSSMRGLDVNIEKFNQNDGIKLGDLVSDEPSKKEINASKKSIKQKRGRKKIVKSLPESFVSEAKMSGRNYQTYEDPNIVDNEE